MPAESQSIMMCAKHKVETFLRCGKCDTPICPDCMVVSPAGTRCKECASHKSSPLFQVPIDRLAIGIAVGLVVASFGGFILASARSIGFLLLWGSLLYGGVVGEAVLRCVYRKRGVKVEIAAGACAILGMLVGLASWMQMHQIPIGHVGSQLGSNPFFLIAMGIAAFGAVSRVRYI